MKDFVSIKEEINFIYFGIEGKRSYVVMIASNQKLENIYRFIVGLENEYGFDLGTKQGPIQNQKCIIDIAEGIDPREFFVIIATAYLLTTKYELKNNYVIGEAYEKLTSESIFKEIETLISDSSIRGDFKLSPNDHLLIRKIFCHLLDNLLGDIYASIRQKFITMDNDIELLEPGFLDWLLRPEKIKEIERIQEKIDRLQSFRSELASSWEKDKDCLTKYSKSYEGFSFKAYYEYLIYVKNKHAS